MAYLSAAEAEAMLAVMLPAADVRRSAFTAASSADQSALIALATADLDAVAWVGARLSADQPLAFPRVFRGGQRVSMSPDPGPAVGEAWMIADIPYEVRAACAIQAGLRAAASIGMADRFDRFEHASSGISSYNAAGRAVSLHQATAASPASRLDPDALARVHYLVRVGGRAV